MIAHLSGTLLSKQANSVIVDVSGVGYEVNIPLSTFYELEDEGSNVQLRIYTHVKEDALQLYGFKTARERELFVNFISVSGIGPKIGIALLSGMSADELIASIKNNNLARLTLIPGVGRKTAERLDHGSAREMTALSSAQLEEEAGTKPEAAGFNRKTMCAPTRFRPYSISATNAQRRRKRSTPCSTKVAKSPSSQSFDAV